MRAISEDGEDSALMKAPLFPSATVPAISLAHLGFFLALTLVAFLADALAQLFLFPGRHESLGYFPSAIALGAMWRFGVRRTWPPLLTGLAGYYLLVYKLPIWAALWTSAMLLLSAAIAMLLMRCTIGVDLARHPLYSLLWFYAIGVVLMPLLHAFTDFPMFLSAGLLHPEDDLRFYFMPYWLGEALGVLLLAPPIFLMGQDFSRFYKGETAVYDDNRAEKLLWVGLFAALLALVVFAGDRYLLNGILDLSFALFAMMLWSALRLGVLFSTLGVAAVTISIVLLGFFGIGGTPAVSDLHDLVVTLGMLLTIALMTQVISVVRLERLLREADLAYAASHDWITDLLNERSIRQALRKAMQPGASGPHGQALGYIVVDQHEILGQGLGLQARNALLHQFGGFLVGSLREQAAVGRISGGEFAAIYDCDFSSARRDLTNLGERLSAFRFPWGGRSFRAGVRMALVPVRDAAMSAERLLAYAGNAARKAASGDAPTVIEKIDPEEMAEQRLRASWLAQLQEALSENRWRLLAQPIRPIGAVAPATGAHFEILLRMRARDGSEIVPGRFLGYAEEFQLMPALDRWVIRQTCLWLASDAVNLSEIAMCSINLSGQSLGDTRSFDYIDGVLRETGVPARKICFEVTETAAIANFRVANELLERLRALGCRLALDDFGTGLASFEYLRSLPIDYLKIDGLFVRHMTATSLDYAIVESIRNVAHFKGVKTIAECVEREETLHLLRRLGIDYAQGFALGRPAPLNELRGAAEARSLEEPTAPPQTG